MDGKILYKGVENCDRDWALESLEANGNEYFTYTLYIVSIFLGEDDCNNNVALIWLIF